MKTATLERRAGVVRTSGGKFLRPIDFLKTVAKSSGLEPRNIMFPDLAKEPAGEWTVEPSAEANGDTKAVIRER